MTVRNALAQADKLRPNAVEEGIKAGWLYSLDAELAESMQVPEPENHWPEDQELLMPEPGSQVYVHYLCAMIDWAQPDMEQYQIDQALYESARTQAQAWWRRTHRPRVSATGARWYP